MTTPAVLLSSMAAFWLGILPPPPHTPAKPSPGAIRFYRVFVPENRMRDWPLGDAKYLPMDAAEFERLVEPLKPKVSNKTPEAPSATALTARYEARLTGERLVGRASVDVVMLGPSPAAWILEPCNLAVRGATWHNASHTTAGGGDETAALGLGGDGRPALRVERSGRLDLEWSLAGRRDFGDAVGFSFELPHAPSNQLILDLPKNCRPLVDRGAVVGNEPFEKGFRRWRIELGGNARFHLHVVTAATDFRPQLALLRESRTYDCSLRGIEVSSQWKLQAHNEPLRKITVFLDPGLRMTSARLGEDAIAWSATPSEKGTRVTMQLPEPIRDAERVVRLGAVGRTTFDRPWRLPRMRAEGLFWQEGNITLLVQEPPTVRRLTPVGCVQTDAGGLSAPRVGQSAQFQAFTPDATVELALAEPAGSPADENEEASNDVPERIAKSLIDEKHAAGGNAGPRTSAKDDSRRPSGSETDANESGRPASAAPRHEPPAVRDVELESWPMGAAGVRHSAVYRLRDANGGRLQLRLPPTIARGDIRNVAVNGQSVSWRWSESGGERRVAVDLPGHSGRTSPQAMIEWVAAGRSLGIVGSLDIAWPIPETRVPPSQWTIWLPSGYRAVRSSPLQKGEAGADAPGWTAWRAIPPTAGASATLRFVHIPSLGILGAIVLLAASLLAHRRLAKRNRKQAACNRNAAGPSPMSGNAVDGGSTVSAAITIGLLLFAGAWTTTSGQSAVGVAMGAEPATPRPSVVDSRPAATAPDVLYRVLVPVDAHRKPSGGKVYVPEPLYQELYRREAVAPENPSAWMILGATYRGELTRDATTDHLTPSPLRVQYDVRIFQCGKSTVRVRLPFHGEASGVLPGSMTLDGRPVEPRWTASGELLLEIGRAGSYRLEFLLRPTLRNAAGGFCGFDAAVPRVPSAKLELDVPRNAPSVEAPSACGGIVRDREQAGDSRRLSVDLGPTDRLSVRWPDGAAARGADVVADADQLTWMKVLPGSVVIAARWKIRVAGGSLQQVQLAADPRLRLLPLTGDNPPAVEVVAEAGPARLLTFRWPRPISSQTTLDVVFLLGGASGVGNFRPPMLELLDTPTTRRWLAFSVDPTLDYEEPSRVHLERATEAEFLKAWGASAERPLAAYRLASRPPDWTLSTRPHEPHVAVEQTWALEFNADRIDAVLDAKISVTSGYVFQHRLTAPRELKVESVSVLEGNVERVGRWSRDEDGSINVFLNSPASGSQRLTIRGRFPPVAGEKWPVPAVRIEKCEIRSAVTRLTPGPNVSLAVSGQEATKATKTLVWSKEHSPNTTITVKPDPPAAMRADPKRPAGQGK